MNTDTRTDNDAWKRAVNEPLPREESLGALFEDLGITNLISGCYGAYSIDMGHFELHELDQRARMFASCPIECFRLKHTTEALKTSSAPIEGGGTRISITFGEIEDPRFVASDGTKYTFISAKFHDGHFHIKATIEKMGAAPIEEERAINEWRNLIGVPL